MRPPLRRTAVTATTLVALMTLSGCFKLDMDMEVSADDTIDGTVIVALDKDLAGMAGAESGDSELTDDDVPEGATIEEYDEDGFVGQKVTFEGITMDELNTSFSEEGETGGPSSWSLTHEGGEYRFTGDMDLTDMAADAEEGLDMGAFMQGAELRIAMTFPGEVTESNGEVDGNTVVWEPEIGEANEMTAVAEEGSGVSVGLVAAIAGGVVVLLLVAAGAFLVLRRRRGAAPLAEQPVQPVQPTQQGGPPAGVS